MKQYFVEVTDSVEKDLFEIFSYVAQHDSLESAEYLFGELEFSCQKLATFPEKGRKVPELRSFFSREYLESFSGPYRIIYTIKKNKVIVLAIFDGRRNLKEVLYRRIHSKDMASALA